MIKAEWDVLSAKAQWDIKVALRGPDSYYGETLKWYTTSVVRGQIRHVFRVGGTINKSLAAIITPKRGCFPEADPTTWNHHHFIEHVRLAAVHLRIPDMRISSDLWHKAMQSPCTWMAARMIMEEYEEEDPSSIKIKKKVLITMLQDHMKAEGVFKEGEE